MNQMPVPDLPFRPLVTVVRVWPDLDAVEVVLEDGGRSATGEVAVEGDDLLAAAGRATCSAVSQLLVLGTEVTLRWVEEHPDTPVRRALINVGVDVTTGEDAEELLGSAFVRNDPQVAAVRAVLHALARRVTASMRR
ncbi:hypothetical protein [Euzebya sp.]|uniref:hypothetical protein n=1 Tax=Euzebya sp. TaxID=1971409 RepID=UPI00351631E5